MTIFFMVFPRPPGVGKETAAMCAWATKIGTLNWSISRHSEVAYSRRICGLMASSNM